MSPSEGKQRNSLSPLDASRLHIQQRQDPRPVGWLEDPPVGVQTDGTDHMLMVRWTLDHGWGDPEIVPYANFSLPPTASCIHYATQCFEGMKVYRGFDGQLRLFRPDRNYERLRTSALRVSLPSFETKQLESLIAALLSVDAPKWLPADSCRGKSLYIRPALIGNGSQIGVRLPEEALLFVIVVPLHGVSPKMLQNGLHLITSPADSTRAWPGGYGSSKIGGNYGPSFVSLGEAQSRGFDQVLWLFGDDGRITEAGASNFFVVWRTPGGALQLITAPLSDKLILPGVTRDSVLSLVRTRLSHTQAHKYSSEPLDAVEDHFTMNDVASAYREGRLVEAFVTGTAVSNFALIRDLPMLTVSSIL